MHSEPCDVIKELGKRAKRMDGTHCPHHQGSVRMQNGKCKQHCERNPDPNLRKKKKKGGER